MHKSIQSIMDGCSYSVYSSCLAKYLFFFFDILLVYFPPNKRIKSYFQDFTAMERLVPLQRLEEDYYVGDVGRGPVDSDDESRFFFFSSNRCIEIHRK